jgi:uncharacterized protein (TIGR00369 family)
MSDETGVARSAGAPPAARTPALAGTPAAAAVGALSATPDMGDGAVQAPDARGDRADEPRPALLSYSDFRIRPHGCFACGELNQGGLHLQLNLEPGRCWVELEMPRRFEGWEGIIHGGILCTVMDEVMAWALVQADSWGVTAKMSVDFRKPVTVGMRVRAEGWVKESRRRIHSTAGRMVDAETGTELVRAEATYLAASDERKRELKERYGVTEGRRQ